MWLPLLVNTYKKLAEIWAKGIVIIFQILPNSNLQSRPQIPTYRLNTWLPHWSSRNRLHGAEYKITCGVCLCARAGFWGRISRKRLEIETWYQWTTNRKWPVANRLVTWSMTSRDLERSRSWPKNVRGPLSRKRLEIQPRLQHSTYRK